MTEVLINGVRYVPAEQPFAEVKFYYMHDNHTFTRLRGATLDEVLAHADVVEDKSSYGMLCPAMLISTNKTVRIGPATHSGSSKDPKDKWNAGKVEWRKAMEANPDVMRLLTANASIANGGGAG